MSQERTITTSIKRSMTVPINAAGILDSLTVQPIAAWSTRRLRAEYTGPCVRIGGNDVGFANSGKVSASTGTVQRWYDQISGSLYFGTGGGVQSLSADSVTGELQITGDGAGYMVSSANISLSGASAATVVVGVRNNQRLTLESLLEQGNPFTGGMSVFANDSVSYTLGNAYGSGGGYVVNNTPVLDNIAKSYCFINIFKPAAGTSDDRAKIRLNGADIDESQAATSGTPNTSGFINDLFYLLGRTASLQSLASIGTVLIFDEELGSTDLAAIEAWMAASWVDNGQVPATYDYSMTPIDRSGYFESSALSSIDLLTSATKIGIKAYCTVANTQFAKVGVYVDGVYSSQVSFSNTASITEQVLTLPAGSKTVTLISGLTSDLGRNLQPAGTYLQSLRANAAMTRQSVSATGTMLAIGDSLTVGGNSDPYLRDGWLMRLRNAASYPVACHAMGFGNIEDYAGDSTKRTALLVKLAQYTPSNFIIALGTNDYQFGTWSAASFGTAYAALLDALNAAYPSADIYCVTPPTLTTESANAQGSTAGNYRTQISTAVSTRTAFATLIDGTAICSSADLVDGVHGNSDWHLDYYTGIAAAVGL